MIKTNIQIQEQNERKDFFLPPRRRTRQPGLFSLSPPSVAGCNEYPAKAGEVNRHIAWYTSPYPCSRSVVLVPGWTGWLAENDISADLREAIAHLTRVRDDALYKSTVTLLYFTLPASNMVDGWNAMTAWCSWRCCIPTQQLQSTSAWPTRQIGSSDFDVALYSLASTQSPRYSCRQTDHETTSSPSTWSVRFRLRYVRITSLQLRLSSVVCLWRSYTPLRGLNLGSIFLQFCSLRTTCLEWSATYFAFIIHHTRTVPEQTDRQTDGQTDGQNCYINIARQHYCADAW